MFSHWKLYVLVLSKLEIDWKLLLYHFRIQHQIRFLWLNSESMADQWELNDWTQIYHFLGTLLNNFICFTESSHLQTFSFFYIGLRGHKIRKLRNICNKIPQDWIDLVCSTEDKFAPIIPYHRINLNNNIKFLKDIRSKTVYEHMILKKSSQQCYYYSSSDVTIANDDGLHLGAHKFIFDSACLMLYIQSFHIMTFILFDIKFLKFA